MPDTSDPSVLEPVQRLSRDIRLAAAQLGDEEARFLVDAYYMMQDDRKRARAQEQSLEKASEPNLVISWLAVQSSTLEQQIKSALDTYTRGHKMGSWMRAVHGIGPVISAGLLAHIYMGDWCRHCRGRDVEDCSQRQTNKRLKLTKHIFDPIEATPTVGHIWQYAGIAGSGQKPWEKGKPRPFNAKLKTIIWHAGQSFMKFSNDPKCVYGHHYREQKDVYIAKNESNGFAERAAERATTVGKSTEAYKFYSTGKLPPAHIDAMARRWAVKLFLAHMHEEWYLRHYEKPAPLPYPIAILGHTHHI